MTPLLVVTSERFAWHQPPPGHPERPERQDVMAVVTARCQARGATVREPEAATDEQLRLVHTECYLASLAATAGHAVMLDPDTFTSPESWDIARLAAGAAIGAVDGVLNGTAVRAAALVRPPGHHAGPSRAMGFCLVNNVAVAAAHALARGISRVAIVDFDVHHGNGTQAVFESDPRVLVVSSHQWPYYPGSGQATEAGIGEGEGFTVNIPMDAGATDADYQLVFDRIVVPIVTEFDPALLLVSAGFDAHELDPLGGMRMTEAGFASLMASLVSVAHMCCDRHVVMVTEGGYHAQALAASLDSSLRVLDDTSPPGGPASGAPDGERTRRGEAAVARSRAVQTRYWRGL